MVWYYFPNHTILENVSHEEVSIVVNNETVKIKDEEIISLLFDAINNNTYYRSATESLTNLTFPSKNLIRIDIYDIKEGGYTTRIHLYILNNNLEGDYSQDLDSLSKGNAVQINDQFYKIKDPKRLSEDVYQLLKDFEVIDVAFDVRY